MQINTLIKFSKHSKNAEFSIKKNVLHDQKEQKNLDETFLASLIPLAAVIANHDVHVILASCTNVYIFHKK